MYFPNGWSAAIDPVSLPIRTIYVYATFKLSPRRGDLLQTSEHLKVFAIDLFCAFCDFDRTQDNTQNELQKKQLVIVLLEAKKLAQSVFWFQRQHLHLHRISEIPKGDLAQKYVRF